MRIYSETLISPQAFETLARRAGAAVFTARKRTRVAARQAARPETVETRWNGAETVNTARAGDWVVTSLGPDGAPILDAEGERNVYVILAERFAALYEPVAAPALAEGAVFAPKGEAEAFFAAEGFDILAPWGERQTAPRGYLIRKGGEVYGNAAETFETAYERVDA